LTSARFVVKYARKAEVAELADALRSGRSEGSLIGVQIPASASVSPDVFRTGLFCRLTWQTKQSNISSHRQIIRGHAHTTFNGRGEHMTTDSFPQSKLLLQRWVAVLMVLAIVLLAYSFNARLATIRQMRQDEARAQQAVSAEEAQQSSLKSQLDYVRSDRYMEHWARVDAKMVKPGEVVIVPMASQVASAAYNVPVAAHGPATIQDEWWILFFGDSFSAP
jgi:cell division protein FtsB